MKCPNCGTENREGVHFCEECGVRIQAVILEKTIGTSCLVCGYANRLGVHFCEECGADLSASTRNQDNLSGNIACPACKHLNRPGVRYCEECGTKLTIPLIFKEASAREWLCKECGHTNRPDVRFCENCGVPLSAFDKSKGTKTTSPFWKKPYLVGGLAGGALLVCSLGAILILGPRQTNLAPDIFTSSDNTPYNNQPTDETPETGSGLSLGSSAQQSSGMDCTDRAELITETIEAGSLYPPQTGFTKAWVLENTGTCTWTTDYSIHFTSGDQMESASFKDLENEVQPTHRITIMVDLVSPSENGVYQSEWFLTNASGKAFGWGSNASNSFTVSIKVNNEVVLAPNSGAIDPSFGGNPPAVGGGPGSQVIDTDDDGLEDWVEDWLANAFLPYVEFDVKEDEKKEDILLFYQVTPIYQTYPEIALHYNYFFPRYDGPPGVLLTYVYTYRWDSGDPYLGTFDHAGDAEMVRIFLVNPRDNPNFYIPAAVIVHRHGLDPFFYFPGQYYGNTSQQWLNGTHLKIYASEDKHAMYIYEDECENYAVGQILLFEECGGGYHLDSPIIPGVNGFNVGERNNHPFSRVPNNPRGLYTTEFVWSGPESMLPIYDAGDNMNIIGTYDASQDFCGGLSEHADFDPFGAGPLCGGGLSGKWWPSPKATTQSTIEYLLGQFANKIYISQYEEQYEICFLTEDVDNAGTDFHVDFTLFGISSDRSKQRLSNVTRGLESLERNSFDCFKAGSYSMRDGIRGIELRVYGASDSDSEWYLNGVVITDRFSHEVWQFQCNCWIDDTNTYDSDIGMYTLGPNVEIPASPITENFSGGGVQDTSLTIVNNGHFIIYNVYYSLSGLNEWYDLLDGAIYTGENKTFSIPQGPYDIRIEGGFDQPDAAIFAEWWNVQIIEPVTLGVSGILCKWALYRPAIFKANG